METCSYYKMLDNYIAPNNVDREVVILTDKGNNFSIMASRGNTVALSKAATNILKRAFIDAIPLNVKNIIEGDTSKYESAIMWIRDSIEDNIFSFSSTPPNKKLSGPIRMTAGSAINVSDFGPKGGVPLEYDGEVVTAEINNTKIYWYTSDKDLNDCMMRIDHESSVSTRGPIFGTTLYPRRNISAVGVNCSGCSGCAVCAVCAGCGLCGGLDLAAAVIGGDGVLMTIGVANAAVALRDVSVMSH